MANTVSYNTNMPSTTWFIYFKDLFSITDDVHNMTRNADIFLDFQQVRDGTMLDAEITDRRY